MVYIDGIKYACERCIRGHRVTTCQHTDQPLTMIKPKGRPTSQCLHCREHRKSKVHAKCLCGSRGRHGVHTSDCPCALDHNLCTCPSKKKVHLNSRRPASNPPPAGSSASPTPDIDSTSPVVRSASTTSLVSTRAAALLAAANTAANAAGMSYPGRTSSISSASSSIVGGGHATTANSVSSTSGRPEWLQLQPQEGPEYPINSFDGDSGSVPAAFDLSYYEINNPSDDGTSSSRHTPPVGPLVGLPEPAGQPFDYGLPESILEDLYEPMGGVSQVPADNVSGNVPGVSNNVPVMSSNVQALPGFFYNQGQPDPDIGSGPESDGSPLVESSVVFDALHQGTADETFPNRLSQSRLVPLPLMLPHGKSELVPVPVDMSSGVFTGYAKQYWD